MTASFSSDSFTPDRLIAGPTVRHSRKVTLTGSAALVRGTLLGVITVGGAYQLSLSAASDGSEDPVAILAEDADASAADVEALIYETGDFNENAVTFGTAHTAASVREALQDRGIFLISTEGA